MHKHMAEARQMLGRHHTMVEPLSTLTARGTVTAHPIPTFARRSLS